jgi:hypothetical protein
MTNGLHHLDQSAPHISECATLIGGEDIFEIQLTVKFESKNICLLLFKKINLREKFSCFGLIAFLCNDL